MAKCLFMHFGFYGGYADGIPCAVTVFVHEVSLLCMYFGAENRDGAWYAISVAAIKAEVHEQTLRHYERLGLISPARKGNSPHSPRLYSDRDIERVVHIRGLMRDLGVNLAGVETILHMRNLIEQMQLEMQDRVER